MWQTVLQRSLRSFSLTRVRRKAPRDVMRKGRTGPLGSSCGHGCRNLLGEGDTLRTSENRNGPTRQLKQVSVSGSLTETICQNRLGPGASDPQSSFIHSFGPRPPSRRGLKCRAVDDGSLHFMKHVLCADSMFLGSKPGLQKDPGRVYGGRRRL